MRRSSAAAFDLIYASGSLRLSRKAYWRRSLDRFASLLAPGGALVTLNANATALRAEVEWLAWEAGFEVIARPEAARGQRAPVFLGLWPTG